MNARSRLRPLLVPTLAVLSAFIVGAIFLVVTDIDHLWKNGDIVGAIGSVGNAYVNLFIGAFGDPDKFATAFQGGTERQWATAIRPITETLVAATPLILCGLGVAVAFRTNMFNIGIEGQFVLGALGATITALAMRDLPAPIILVAALIVGTICGAAWGWLPGWLKARAGAHEVITTIMLNYVAAQIVLFALRSDWLRYEGTTQPISKVVWDFVKVPALIPLASLRLHWGIVVALLVAILVSWFLFRTAKGFELRTSGFSLTAARYAGMSAGGSITLAMTISGALAGLAGGFQVLGTQGQMSSDISSGFGWDAIAIALVGALRPGGVVAAALLFGALRTGGATMQVKTGIPIDLIFFIQALVIMFVAAPALVRMIYRIRVGRRPAAEGAPA